MNTAKSEMPNNAKEAANEQAKKLIEKEVKYIGLLKKEHEILNRHVIQLKDEVNFQKSVVKEYELVKKEQEIFHVEGSIESHENYLKKYQSLLKE